MEGLRPDSARGAAQSHIGILLSLPMEQPESGVLRFSHALRPDRSAALPQRAGNRLHHGGRPSFAHDAGVRQRTHPRHGRNAGRAAAAARAPRRAGHAGRPHAGASCAAGAGADGPHARRAGPLRPGAKGPRAGAVQHHRAQRVPAAGAGRIPQGPSARLGRPGRTPQLRNRRCLARRYLRYRRAGRFHRPARAAGAALSP